MPGRPFAAVLEDALHDGATTLAAHSGPWRRTTPMAPAVHVAPMPPWPGSGARSAYVLAAVAPLAPTARREAQRPLTPAQRRALDGLNASGGRLAPDFTAGELRAAYRRLAHRLHPDRHHTSTECHRAQLGRDFADATGHYHVLLALFRRH